MIGLRVGVFRGCSGLLMSLNMPKKAKLEEEESKGVKIFIDPMAIMYIMGSEMDYKEDTKRLWR